MMGNENMERCTICKEQVPKNDIMVHKEIYHKDQITGIKKRSKIGMVFALVGFSIVIGMIMAVLL